MVRFTTRGSRTALPAAAAALALTFVLQGCGGGGDTTTTPTTTGTTTTTVYQAPGQCSDDQRKAGCAYGFCNKTDPGCACMANYESTNGDCVRPSKQQPITFYMYRAQDSREFTWSNDDLASISGVVWYLHNEVVIQSCPRHYNITRVLRLKVTVHNTDAMFQVRQSIFGPFATFDSGGCHDCEQQIFSHYGYVVGCQIPGAADNYTWGGYKPMWYSLPGECPSKDRTHKNAKCVRDEPGGMCDSPNGNNTCTWNYTDAGNVLIEELYGDNFDMNSYCRKVGGHNIPGEYDRGTDKGKYGVNFWDDKGNKAKNAQRVEALRAAFKKKYPDQPDLPEPWCDFGTPPPSQQKVSVVV